MKKIELRVQYRTQVSLTQAVVGWFLSVAIPLTLGGGATLAAEQAADKSADVTLVQDVFENADGSLALCLIEQDSLNRPLGLLSEDAIRVEALATWVEQEYRNYVDKEGEGLGYAGSGVFFAAGAWLQYSAMFPNNLRSTMSRFGVPQRVSFYLGAILYYFAVNHAIDTYRHDHVESETIGLANKILLGSNTPLTSGERKYLQDAVLQSKNFQSFHIGLEGVCKQRFDERKAKWDAYAGRVTGHTEKDKTADTGDVQVTSDPMDSVSSKSLLAQSTSSTLTLLQVHQNAAGEEIMCLMETDSTGKPVAALMEDGVGFDAFVEWMRAKKIETPTTQWGVVNMGIGTLLTAQSVRTFFNLTKNILNGKGGVVGAIASVSSSYLAIALAFAGTIWGVVGYEQTVEHASYKSMIHKILGTDPRPMTKSEAKYLRMLTAGMQSTPYLTRGYTGVCADRVQQLNPELAAGS